jgi:hypothetical protein
MKSVFRLQSRTMLLPGDISGYISTCLEYFPTIEVNEATERVQHLHGDWNRREDAAAKP